MTIDIIEVAPPGLTIHVHDAPAPTPLHHEGFQHHA